MEVTLKIKLRRYGPESDPHDVAEAIIDAMLPRRGGVITTPRTVNPTFYEIRDVDVVEVRGE